jgi:glycosyltransferase involved in cell wall biosynthesis
MRVLIISWEYPPYINGGLGRHVAELIPALNRQGVETHVVTPAFDPLAHLDQLQTETCCTDTETPVSVSVTQENGITVHRVLATQDKTKTDVFKQAQQTNHLIETYLEHLYLQGDHWDLIHTHDWLTGFAGLHLKHARSVPLVSTIHATERGRVRGFLNSPLQQAIDQTERNLVHGSDRVIVCSHFMSNELQSFFHLSPAKLEVIPNGVDMNSLPRQFEGLDAFRAKYADPDDRIVFTVSRLVYEKGVHRLIEATPAILANCPQAKIIVAGRGPEAENLQNQAKYLGVADRVKFVGFISNEERDRFFKIASCAVFPSLYEPFGIVALEAMALECPVVVSYVGGLAEMVKHQETGITIFPDDAASVAWGVSYALTHPVWARRHAIQARQVVEEQFNWTRIAALTKAVYQQTIEAQNVTIHLGSD